MIDFNSIGALWTDMSERSPIPTAADRAAQKEAMRRGLPAVEHKIQMRYERLFDTWRVTFVDNGRTLRECTFVQDYKLEDTIKKGRGIRCLADRQAVELGMRQGSGIVMLLLNSEQYASLAAAR